MLSAISLAQKDKYYVLSLIYGSRKVDFIDVESRIVATRG
jgi:hypothetical protein